MFIYFIFCVINNLENQFIFDINICIYIILIGKQSGRIFKNNVDRLAYLHIYWIPFYFVDSRIFKALKKEFKYFLIDVWIEIKI